MPEKVHHGKAVKRIREILQIKHEALAFDLGMSQQNVSVLETKEVLDADMLDRIAAALKVPVDAIKNFDEDAAVNTYFNTFNDNSSVGSFGTVMEQQSQNNYCTFNPMDKIIELYERLVQTEKEKTALAEKLAQQLQKLAGSKDDGN